YVCKREFLLSSPWDCVNLGRPHADPPSEGNAWEKT
ncbi:MAG: hypothetical protein UX62_C0052G0006, partial [Microgenomates group bacterium GW2011_GWA2_46_7]